MCKPTCAPTQVLGKGQFGTTRQCVHFATGHHYACKSISKRTITQQEEIEDVRREVQVSAAAYR